MKTEWDYTELANAYLERPPYSPDALAQLFHIAGLHEGSKVCDIGAGVGHLTIPLAERGCTVVAVEPNDAMRKNGINRTRDMANVTWVEASGEKTGQSDGAFDFLTYGSSFNVMDRQKALAEAWRILKPDCWFACMWNHRDLEDPIQREIERIISRFVPGYSYGIRREDQAAEIERSKRFVHIQIVTGQLKYAQSVEQVVEAWRSHGTVHRQAGENFPAIISAISEYLRGLGAKEIIIPYTTRAWIAQRA